MLLTLLSTVDVAVLDDEVVVADDAEFVGAAVDDEWRSLIGVTFASPVLSYSSKLRANMGGLLKL